MNKDFFRKIGEYVIRNREVILLILIIVAAVLPFAINLLHYPYFEYDEGTYMAEAWAVATKGALSHYTYWYDHAPIGWIFIAIWTHFTGGFFSFGIPENSGRVFMLVLHVCIALLVYGIGKRLSKNSIVGAVAALIFCFSPLGIYFERRVLLDNIMTFWLMLALFFIVKEQPKLRHIGASAVSFALAILTKENAIFAFFGLCYGVVVHTSRHIRRFAVSTWMIISGSICSLYVLYALIKNEFFPAKHGEHVSLISTLKFQASRGNGLPFWNIGSDFYQNFSEWILRDRYIVYLGLLALVISTFLAIRHKALRALTLITIFSFLFVMRGGLVINFYIIPFIPLFALHIALVLWYAISAMLKSYRVRSIAIGLLGGVIIFLLVTLPSFADLYKTNETNTQIGAVQWAKDNLPADTEIIIDGHAFVAMHDVYYNEKKFVNADWFLKVKEDPEVRELKLHNDWKQIDYIMLSHGMAWQLKYADHALVSEALTHSVPIQVFSNTVGQEAWTNPEQFAIDHADSVIILKVIHNDVATE